MMIGDYKRYEDYEKALRTRLDSLINLFNTETEYPYQVRILGFELLRVNSEEELVARIKELCQLLHVPFPLLVEETERYTKEARIL